ncbi:SDR family oxidoreductase [Georgenia wutianyii]|uniref:SDR family oxidoreductase n=1 Tax=Georgenia wutianyii TaxID=2585135 RepID=A0ABX5VPP4_9MICO|nr:SDR family oxidoreductase [Georgenia wutianyii]QDB80461.1 SDR family oxidoreductase [Georgenia wutianyii]
MLLTDKTAVVYGGAGAIGSAVARTFAAEGAVVHLAGRTLATLEEVAGEIRAAGGQAHAAVVDALDGGSVAQHAAAVIAESGGIDVSLNAVGVDHVQGVPLTELRLADFELPVRTYTRTNFLTATTVARHMGRRGSGVVLLLSTTAARVAMATDGFGPANAAVEALAVQLAGEVGPRGVRVVALRPDGIPETARHGSHVARVWARMAERAGMTLAELLESPGAPNGLLPGPVRIQDVADAAAFLASDRAGGLTATTLNLSGGAVLG